jgi:hypothetical protein
LIGSDSSKWTHDAALFGGIRVIDACPGIDVRMYGTDRFLEYDVLVKPGARLDSFRLRLDGEATASINAHGEAETAVRTASRIWWGTRTRRHRAEHLGRAGRRTADQPIASRHEDASGWTDTLRTSRARVGGVWRWSINVPFTAARERTVPPVAQAAGRFLR